MIASFSLMVALMTAIVHAIDGGDISEYYGSETFSCCRRNGWNFVVIRSYHSYGGVDTNAPATLAQAKAAGIPQRDIYHFPCYGKVSASKQVQDDVNHVGKGNFGMLWFDIETNPSPGCGWSSNKADNCNFMKELISAGSAEGVKMGIYASNYMWSSIMGSCTVGHASGLPLWYAHYDGRRTFADFTPFGGWTAPSFKQYADSVGMCGINADADWYP